MSNRTSRRNTEQVSDAALLRCLSETPVPTAVISRRTGLSGNAVRASLLQIRGVMLVRQGGQRNLWKVG